MNKSGVRERNMDKHTVGEVRPPVCEERERCKVDRFDNQEAIRKTPSTPTAKSTKYKSPTPPPSKRRSKRTPTKKTKPIRKMKMNKSGVKHREAYSGGSPTCCV